MAIPNIVAVSEIYAKLATMAVTDAQSQLIDCPTGKTVKINAIYLTNVSASNATCSVTIAKSGAGMPNVKIVDAMNIAPNSAVTPVTKDSSIYLEEGDEIILASGDDATVEATCSYEVIS
ncbi:MAG: hypothetical protein LC687_05355 [Actinobacteria bacterium]|nr:hypothetical protein [Actinomycetota bacterium]